MARKSNGLTYILPIKTRARATPELVEYVRWLGSIPDLEPIIVDGSPGEIFELHSRVFGPEVLHVRPRPDLDTPMGKVGGVLTGLGLASHERMIIADDDVRYDLGSMRDMNEALDTADVVRPQNYFSPVPIHAAWDTARVLLNRLLDGDWPGTLGVRRSALRRTGGYDGRAMFENLELVRTIVAGGGRETVRRDLYVMRRPPTASHFWSQRIRQAYDEIARPRRLLAQLAVLPATIALGIAGYWLVLTAAAALLVLAAEAGRRRDGGIRYFPAAASLLAPAWVAERAICSWLAVGTRVFMGGVLYRGRVLRHAATSMRVLMLRHQRTSGRPYQPSAIPHRSV